jgi:hypothetical protein
VQLRADWKYVGIGAGIALSPSFDQYDSGTAPWPTGYLRGGPADGVHVRLDAFPLTSFSAQHIVRLGIGYNAVRRDQPSMFLGLAGLGSNEGSTGLAGELTIPLTDRFALSFDGHYAGGHAHPVSGLAAGGRLLLGGGPRMNASTPLVAPPVDMPVSGKTGGEQAGSNTAARRPPDRGTR